MGGHLAVKINAIGNINSVSFKAMLAVIGNGARDGNGGRWKVAGGPPPPQPKYHRAPTSPIFYESDQHCGKLPPLWRARLKYPRNPGQGGRPNAVIVDDIHFLKKRVR